MYTLVSKWLTFSTLVLAVVIGTASFPHSMTADSTQEYYVAIDGDDENPGTIDKPWRTIQKAADTMIAGDKVYVRDGTYTSVSLRRSGLPDRYITFKAYPGETPVLDGGGWAGFDDRYVETKSLEYFTIDGFEIRNFENGIDLIRSNNFIISNNMIHHNLKSGIGVQNSLAGEIANNLVFDIRDFGIVIKDSENLSIQNNTVYNINQFTGISLERVTNIDIHHNTVYSCSGNGIMLSFQSDNNSVHQNITYRNSCGDDRRFAGIAIEVDSKNNTVYNNLIYDNCHAGFLTNSPNNLIYHNVMYGNTEAQVSNGPWRGSYPTGNIFKNNIFVVPYNNDPTDPSNRAVTFWGSGYNPLDNTFDYNLYYYVNGPDLNGIVAVWPNTYSFGEWQEMGIEQNGVLANPEFVDPYNLNFHLKSNSPAIDSGANVGILDDYDGNSRPLGVAPDIGAFEFRNKRTTSTPEHTNTSIPAINTPQPPFTSQPSIVTSEPSPTSTPNLETTTLTPIPNFIGTLHNSTETVENHIIRSKEDETEITSTFTDSQAGEGQGISFYFVKLVKYFVRGLHLLVDCLVELVELITYPFTSK